MARACVLCECVVICIGIAGLARADAASDAKDLFEQARQLRLTGDCAHALPLFQKAHELLPTALGSLRNVAECEEALGHAASARRAWLEIKRSLLVENDAKYAGWDADADAASTRLAQLVAHLTVGVDVRGGGPSDVEVTINGEPLAPTLFGTALDRDPGHYVIRARPRSGGEPQEQSLDLDRGGVRVVGLVVHVPASTQVKEAAPAASVWRPAGWVTLSVGLGALVGMGIAVGVRQDALSTLNASCASHLNCPLSVEPAVNRGTAASTTATVLAIGGGVVAGAGIIMLVVDALSHHMRRPMTALAASPSGVGLVARFE